jgi:hypothetical protein
MTAPTTAPTTKELSQNYLHWRELPFDRLRANVFSLPFLYPELVDAYFEIVSKPTMAASHPPSAQAAHPPSSAPRVARLITTISFSVSFNGA